jgi:hypothetical protein
LDAHAWRTATRSAPFVVQAVLGLLIVNMWAWGKGLFTTESGRSERAWLLTAALTTTVESLLIVAALLRSPSSRHRGLSLSIAGCSAAVLLGGTIFAYTVMR